MSWQLDVLKFVKFIYINDKHPLKRAAVDSILLESKWDKSTYVIFEHL